MVFGSFCFTAVLGMESRAVCMLRKCSTTEYYTPAWGFRMLKGSCVYTLKQGIYPFPYFFLHIHIYSSFTFIFILQIKIWISIAISIALKHETKTTSQKNSGSKMKESSYQPWAALNFLQEPSNKHFHFYWLHRLCHNYSNSCFTAFSL
jgi:hypothetical protein